MRTQNNYTLDQFPQFAAEVFNYLNNLESRLSQSTPTQTETDRCDLSDAKKITGLSESKLYKLTATNEIPVKRYGKKLIFSRKELIQWVESKTISDTMQSNAVLELAKSANKKRA